MENKNKDYTSYIEQFKEDLQKLETDILIIKVKLEEMQKHKESIICFLDALSY